MTALAIGLAGTCLLVLVWWWWNEPPCVRKRVLVNLKSGDEAFSGVLWQMKGAWMVLRDVDVVRVDGGRSKADGEVVIHRSNVAFVQVS